MLPRIEMTGNVVDDPALRYTGKGTPVMNFRLAANKWRKDGDRWVESEAVFLNVTAWDKLAEQCAEALHKGGKVHVVGELRQREFKPSSGDGEARTIYEINAKDIFAQLRQPAERATQPGEDPWATDNEPAPF
jgi:single-strand DNA-binding protein